MGEKERLSAKEDDFRIYKSFISYNNFFWSQLGQLKEFLIDNQLSNISYFTSLMHAHYKSTCNQKIQLARNAIFQEFYLLLFKVIQDQLNYNSSLYQAFIDFYFYGVLAEALERVIANAIRDTPIDCFLLDGIKYGSVQCGFQAGNTDVFAYKKAYILQSILLQLYKKIQLLISEKIKDL